jgi:hypothetical protein
MNKVLVHNVISTSTSKGIVATLRLQIVSGLAHASKPVCSVSSSSHALLHECAQP